MGDMFYSHVRFIVGENSGEEESHLDESDDKLNLSLTAEEPEDIKPAPEPMETQAYDTRSEAGSSEGESTHSDTETSISDSGNKYRPSCSCTLCKIYLLGFVD